MYARRYRFSFRFEKFKMAASIWRSRFIDSNQLYLKIVPKGFLKFLIFLKIVPQGFLKSLITKLHSDLKNLQCRMQYGYQLNLTKSDFLENCASKVFEVSAYRTSFSQGY